MPGDNPYMGGPNQNPAAVGGDISFSSFASRSLDPTRQGNKHAGLHAGHCKASPKYGSNVWLNYDMVFWHNHNTKNGPVEL